MICGGTTGCIAVYKGGPSSGGGSGAPTTPTVQITDNVTGLQTALKVGDSITFLVTGAAPFSLVFASEPGWSANLGYTDANGTFRLNGFAGADVVGSYQQTWTIGGVVAKPTPLQFTISK